MGDGAEIRRLAERARSNKTTRESWSDPRLRSRAWANSRHRIHAHHQRARSGDHRLNRRLSGRGGARCVVVRRIMNLSSSFDHRFVDGYDAAAMIQALKERLEHPATILFYGESP